MSVNRVVLTLIALGALGIPAGAQGTWAIRNARIVTVSGSTIERGTLLIRDGKIAELGPRISIPRGARRIDGRGLRVYPGLMDADTNLGLTEIGRVAETNDFSEMGEFMPQLLAFSAFHAESEHIPVARVDGITTVLTRPSGGIIAGQGAIMSLAGWTPEEMAIERRGALILNFPSLLPIGRRGFGRFRGRRRPFSELKKEYEKKVRRLKALLARARHYAEARRAAPRDASLRPDRQLQALGAALAGKEVVLIRANSHVDIRNAVRFAREEHLNYVLLGAGDAWRVADFLQENQVRLILGPRQSLPYREDDPVDIIYRTPAILHQHGVPFAIATGGSANVRTLPFEAGNAVAYGLPREAALQSITLTPARFLGVADRLGSLEKGKRADLVVTDGDILEYQTHIRYLFIGGRPVPLESRHTRLYRKYLKRP